MLDRLPPVGDLLGHARDRIKQKLFDAFDIQTLYSKAKNQVTLWATITPATPAAQAAIIAASETPTSPPKIIFRIWHAILGRPHSYDHDAGTARPPGQ